MPVHYAGYERRRFRTRRAALKRGLLIEPAATNLLPTTTDFSGWSIAAFTRTPGVPLRKSTYGVQITCNTGGASFKTSSASALPSTVMCLSWYWKKGTQNSGTMSSRDAADSVTAMFASWNETAPGTLAFTISAGAGNGYFYLDDGWYRLWVYATTYVAANGYTVTFQPGTAGTYDYYALPQFEAGRFPSSPIPNAGAGTVTRAEDQVSRVLATGLLGATQGALAIRSTILAQNDILGADQHLGKVSSATTNYAHVRSAGNAGLRGAIGGQGQAQAATPLSTYYNRKTAYGVRGNAAGSSLHAAGAQVAATAVAVTDMSLADRILLLSDGGNPPMNAILWELATYAVDPGAAALNAADAGALPGGSTHAASFVGALPAGWTFARTSTALDDQLVAVAANTPRFAAGAF